MTQHEMEVNQASAEWRRMVLLGLLVVLAWTSPHLVLGGDTYFRIHDYLDSVVVWAKVLADQGLVFSPQTSPVAPMMGGVARSSFGSEFNPFQLLMMALPASVAILVNEIVFRFTAFIGMLLLLRDSVLAEHPDKKAIAICVSIMFCTLPFWPGGGVSVAGVPLAMWAFFEARRGSLTWIHVLAIAYFAVYSGIAGIGVFILISLGLVWLIDWLRGRRSLKPLVLLLMLAFFYLLADYRLFVSLASNMVVESHRKEMKIEFIPLWDALLVAKTNFLVGQYHALPVQKPLMLWGTCLAMLLPLVARLQGRGYDVVLYRRLLTWCGAIAATALLYGLWQWAVIQQVWANAGLPYINLARFHWLQPALWLVVMALSMGLLATYLRPGRKWLYIFLIALTLFQLRFNWMQGDFRRERKNDGITFNEFYSPLLFEDVSKAIGLPKSDYRVGMIGVHPAVALYNGFYTVDGYVVSYGLSYKRQFRKIIAGELERDEALKRYFDEWGSRAYLFSSELLFCDGVCVKSRVPENVNPRLDMEAFRAVGGRYIFSATGIGNAKALGLDELGVFERSDSPWRIHVYFASGR